MRKKCSSRSRNITIFLINFLVKNMIRTKILGVKKIPQNLGRKKVKIRQVLEKTMALK